MPRTKMLSKFMRRPVLRVHASALSRQTVRNAAVSAVAHSIQESHFEQRHDEFWRRVPAYENVSSSEFLSHRWSIHNTVQGKVKLWKFLDAVVPDEVPYDKDGSRTQRREDLLKDVVDGVDVATMAIRVAPYVLSRINWKDPRNDPVFRQFIPLKSVMLPDHPKLTPDSLHEVADSPVQGLVHRYPDKALFLATPVCPTYCIFCTRAYGVGGNTYSVIKMPFKPTRRRWEAIFEYIESNPQLEDIVISGGDSYLLEPGQIKYIGERLISIPHIRRIRFASRGLSVAPMRILDPNDGWAAALANVTAQARQAGKSVALHTHFNHPDEISWITQKAARHLLEAGVTVRNQTVLMKGVNDDVETMSKLIRSLADNNISPYYVYMCDMIKMVEHLRTPLQTMLDIEAQIRGSIAGFMMPQFVVDLPGGGGKRLACSYQSYDRTTGISKFVAPAITTGGRNGSKKPEVFEYHDPFGTRTGHAGGSGCGDEHVESR